MHGKMQNYTLHGSQETGFFFLLKGDRDDDDKCSVDGSSPDLIKPSVDG